jgi:hypothetical protein
LQSSKEKRIKQIILEQALRVMTSVAVNNGTLWLKGKQRWVSKEWEHGFIICAYNLISSTLHDLTVGESIRTTFFNTESFKDRQM